LRIQVKLFDIFRDFFPPGADVSDFWLDFQNEAKLGDIFSKLGIPENLPKVIICNNRVWEENQVLKAGDVIAIFSPISGG